MRLTWGETGDRDAPPNGAEVVLGEMKGGRGLPTELGGPDLMLDAAVDLIDSCSMALSTSLASAEEEPPVLLRARRRDHPSSLAGAVPVSRLVVLLRAPALPGPERTLETRGDESPSSLRSASAVPLSAAATVSISMPSNSGSRVWRRMDAAMMEGDEWWEWKEEWCESRAPSDDRDDVTCGGV